MKTKKATFTLLTLLTLLSLTLLACSTCQASDWQEVTTFTGASDQTTDYFNITASEWRITWNYTPSSDYPDMAGFGFFAYPKGEDAMYSAYGSMMGANETSGVTYVHEGNQQYYLKINVANLQGYNIKIEQDLSTIPEFSTFAVLTLLALGTVSVASVVVCKKKASKP
jgi:hypothetical protein